MRDVVGENHRGAIQGDAALCSKTGSETGATFTEYVVAQRLARAHRLVTDPRLTGRTLTAIAFEVGFDDLSYFNRAFRRRFGATPSDVRAQARRDLRSDSGSVATLLFRAG